MMFSNKIIKQLAVVSCVSMYPCFANAGDGWIDVVVKVHNISADLSENQIQDAEKFAAAYARIAANATVRFGKVPVLDLKYIKNEYRFYFVDPTDNIQKFIKWTDVMKGEWILVNN